MSKPRSDPPDPVIARLGPDHDLSSFDCGNETLNRYLASIATQDLRRGLAIPYVLTFAPGPRIVAYFTLSAASIDLGALPERVRKRLPAGAVVGASLLGRLAVDRRHQGEGLAALMVATAANLSFAQSPLGRAAMVVDAIDARAAEFYEHLGFVRVPDGPRRLFMLRESLAKYL
jgi:GNAT superfamily N-acetyltransferase